MFTTAFLQHSGKGPLRHEESLLETGLRRRGIPVEHYTVKRIHRRQLPLGPQRRKSFTGAACYSERDFAVLGKVSRRQRVWCSELVRWLTEYRVYVIDGRIVAVDHYDGDGAVPLDLALVEANDGYALGAYAIDADLYTELVLRRWRQLLVDRDDSGFD
ncbi:ATP-grasp domain-containing protein [Nocardia otitidiscaviarum]|uniref:ATP-grasp domain-containing protein n=1 Tax=Nocardia otitidiscaviarum TaxID=1823 RepID=UPI0004A73BB5|nr:ATP-grasp domain-containing protein [Nocardia otitidiscaviarum]MBF6135515.1 ATP-grasp domain-containing protein [Nocardia otitidiscaviarum]MBF6487332.1 ATP-grasp domain-containing protein [Nocardia otitidiscaviarum]